MKYARGTFLLVPNKEALKRVDGLAQAIYMWLCDYANDNGVCFPSIPTLAELTQSSESTIRVRLEQLQKLGLLTYVQRKAGEKRNLTNLYQLHIIDDEVGGGGVTMRGGGVMVTPGGGVTMRGEVNPLKVNPLTYEKPKGLGEEFTYEEVNDEGEPVVRRKGMKRPVTIPPYEFSYEEELRRLKSSPVKVHKIVAFYTYKKGATFDSREQWEPYLAREIKAAKNLKGYSSDQLSKVFAYCEKEWQENWTLETVSRWAPQILK